MTDDQLPFLFNQRVGPVDCASLNIAQRGLIVFIQNLDLSLKEPLQNGKVASLITPAARFGSDTSKVEVVPMQSYETF